MEQLNIFGEMYEEFKPKNKLRLITLFSGYDSQALSLKYMGVEFEHYRTCEWAYKSIQALKDLHFYSDEKDYSENMTYQEVVDFLVSKGISENYNKPMAREQIERKKEKWCRQVYNNIHATHNMVNIQQVKGSDLGIKDKQDFTYLLTYSFPCITEDSLILTKQGYKEFKDVKIGEYVLTKSNTWQKVAKKFDNGTHKTYFLQGMGFENIHCTDNHKFYVREMYREWNNEKRKYERKFKVPTFKEVKYLSKKDYFGIPVLNEEKEFYTNDLDFWYLIGYYLGDGWLSKSSNDIILACNDTKLEKLKKQLDVEKYKYTINKERTCYKLRFSNKEIHNFINKNIGSGSGNKNICGEILNLPNKQLKKLLQGYIDSDGCIIDNKIQFSSINRKLIYSISLIINKVYKRPTSISKIFVKSKKTIENRVVNQKDWYLLRFKIENDIQDKAFYENGYIWYPFTKIVEDSYQHVYNMEIENDHSYIVQGCISKNCQDLSLAGKGAGMSKGGSTRSGMLWEVERILNECHELGAMPDVLIMENVPQVHGVKALKDFKSWLLALEELGYESYWQDMNTKEYGIPQNRDRTFMVSILSDKNQYHYNFPKKRPLNLWLKQILQKEKVDESFYLSDKQLKDVQNWKAYEKPLDKMEITDKSQISPTLTTRTGAYAAGMILVKEVLLKRGYSIEIKDEQEQTDEIDVIGNYSKSDYNATVIVGKGGVAPTVRENHGQVTAIVENFPDLKELEDFNIGGGQSLMIKNATKQGYLEAEVGDGIDIGSRMASHRGTVQKGVSQTLKTQIEVGVVVEDE